MEYNQKPLTLEQLRQMDGQPAWGVSLISGKPGEWFIVRIVEMSKMWTIACSGSSQALEEKIHTEKPGWPTVGSRLILISWSHVNGVHKLGALLVLTILFPCATFRALGVADSEREVIMSRFRFVPTADVPRQRTPECCLRSGSRRGDHEADYF